LTDEVFEYVRDDNVYSMFRRVAQAQPDHDAVIFDERVLSYGELDQLALKIAAGLAGLGVEPGDRVLFYAPNSPELLATYLACSYLGAIFAPVNPVFRASELRYICANAEPRVAIVHSNKFEDFEAAGYSPLTIVVQHAPGETGAGAGLTFESLVNSAAATPDRYPTQPHDPAVICYTSGSTARPKPVLHSQVGEVYTATVYSGVWGLGPTDRAVVALPLAWVYGLTSCCLSLLCAGSTNILRPRFHPVDIVKQIEAHRATVFYGTMSLYVKLLDVLRREHHDLTSLRMCLNGAEPCPDAAVSAFQDFTGVRLTQAYGTSEVRPLIAQRPDDTNAPFNGCGQRVAGAKVRLLDENGNQVAVGEAGEAEAAGPGLMLGYWREPELTAQQRTADGWMKMGDLLVEDEQGYFRVIGRRSDMIIRSGANVAPAEVESAILSHPAVAGAVVVGVPDEASGETVVAIVAPEPDGRIEAEELKAYLMEILASYKIPSQFLIVDEVAVNASGKADRRAAREHAQTLLGSPETAR
jgi:long-chain acyl-CoA synthetase